MPGRQWDFDALRGDNLFLIKYLSGGGYQVRLLHVASGKLEAKPLKDPHESGTIWGQPYSRLASTDGRYLFTLYIGSNGGSMIHALDLDTAKARCIDLPGTGDYLASTAWGLALARGGHTLWAANPSHGRVVGIDVRTRKVTRAFRIDVGVLGTRPRHARRALPGRQAHRARRRRERRRRRTGGAARWSRVARWRPRRSATRRPGGSGRSGSGGGRRRLSALFRRDRDLAHDLDDVAVRVPDP